VNDIVDGRPPGAIVREIDRECSVPLESPFAHVFDYAHHEPQTVPVVPQLRQAPDPRVLIGPQRVGETLGDHDHECGSASRFRMHVRTNVVLGLQLDVQTHLLTHFRLDAVLHEHDTRQ
jgi:hypothetical protein